MYVQFPDEFLLSSAGEVTGCIMSNGQVRQFHHHSRNGCLEVTLYNDTCVEGKFCGYFLHGYQNLCFKEMPPYPYVYCRYMLVTCEDAADCIKVRFIKT